MSNKIKFTSYNDANEVANKLFKSLRLRHERNLETSVRDSDFIFDSVQLMYYKCHINFPDWLKKKKKKKTIKSKNEDDQCFHYATTVTLNQKEIKRDQERSLL